MQVKVYPDEGPAVSRLMPAWFGEHVDRVAMRDGLYGSDAISSSSSGRPRASAPDRRRRSRTR